MERELLTRSDSQHGGTHYASSDSGRSGSFGKFCSVIEFTSSSDSVNKFGVSTRFSRDDIIYQ